MRLVWGGVLINFVYYYGRKYGIDKVRFYEDADIFVAPSFDEAFPLVNLEAMQFALPVVATNVGGVTEEVLDGENGLIAKTGDSASLADCLEKLMKDGELRRRMGEKGYRKFRERFTLTAFESRFTDFLSVCVGGGNRQ